MSDPYSPFDEPESQLLTWSRASTILGILAMTLCLMGFCSCQLTTLVAVPVSGIAIHLSRRSSTSEDGETKAYSGVGLATAVIALLYSLMMITLLALYILLYVVMFGAMMVAGL